MQIKHRLIAFITLFFPSGHLKNWLFRRMGWQVGVNRVTGPLWVVLCAYAGIGNHNTVLRSRAGITWGRAMFKLGIWSKRAVSHVVDCTRSVKIGDYAILAGGSNQPWTHGYLHAPQGLGRFRIDGSATIGDNCYFGSACVMNAGVRIADAITVGAASCVSRWLDRAGLFVSQPLRSLEMDYEEAQDRYPQVNVEGLFERVVIKHPTAKV